MAPRRYRKQKDSGIALIVIAVLVFAIISVIVRSIAENAAIFIIIVIGAIGATGLFYYLKEKRRQQEAERAMLYAAQASEARYNALLQRFNDPGLVRRIMDRNIEQGDTPEIVQAALGQPVAVDREALKTKSRETWKYKKGNERRSDQYNVQVKFENGQVVGWEDRS